METGSVPAVCWRRGGVAPWSCAVQLMERNSINRVLVTGRSVNKLLTSLKDVWKMALELWRSPRGGDGALDACGLTSLAQTYAWPAALGSFATSRIPMDAVAASALVVAGYPWHLALTTRDCWDLACMHSSMASCVRCNDWPYALELFDALGTGCLGLRSPNIISYNSLLRSEPTWSSALRVFQEVAEVGLRRSSFTWTSTLASVPWREAMQETNEPPHISGFTHVQPWREAVRALDESFGPPRIPSHLQVKVLAKSFEATCSHAAGAWWIPDPSSPASRFAQASESGARYVRWAKETWKEMQDVEHCRMVPGVRLYLPSALQHGELCLEGPNSLQALVQKFQRLERLVVKGFRGLEPPKSGISFETQFTKMDAYLAHLRGELNRSGRCQLLEREVSSLEEVTAAYSNAVAIVNCCGLTAGTLAKDPTMFAARGQTVLVDAPEQTSFFSLQTGDQRPVYVLPQGDGTVAVGGCFLPEPRSPDASASRRVPGREGGWQCPELDQQLAEDILRDAQAWCPALRGRPVLRQPVDLSGVRPQTTFDRMVAPPEVIHNYGHGDVGVILSWGSAKEVAEILLAMTQSKL
eukprot:g7839.t1